MVSHLLTSLEQPTKRPKRPAEKPKPNPVLLDVEYFNHNLRYNDLETDANIQQMFSENVYPKGRRLLGQQNGSV